MLTCLWDMTHKRSLPLLEKSRVVIPVVGFLFSHRYDMDVQGTDQKHYQQSGKNSEVLTGR